MADKKIMRIKITDERRADMIRGLTQLFAVEFDEQLSRFRAEQILEYFVKTMGPNVYNQAIQDARGFMFERLEDLTATFYEE